MRHSYLEIAAAEILVEKHTLVEVKSVYSGSFYCYMLPELRILQSLEEYV